MIYSSVTRISIFIATAVVVLLVSVFLCGAQWGRHLALDESKPLSPSQMTDERLVSHIEETRAELSISIEEKLSRLYTERDRLDAERDALQAKLDGMEMLEHAPIP